MDADDLHETKEPPAPDDRHIEMRLGLGGEVSYRVNIQPSCGPGEELRR